MQQACASGQGCVHGKACAGGGAACETGHQEMHETPLGPSPRDLPWVVAACFRLPQKLGGSLPSAPAEAVGGLLCTISCAGPLVRK